MPGCRHALALAREGADIIAVDVCSNIDSISYPMSTLEDLAKTVKETEALDRRAIAVQADVREFGAMRDAVARGIIAVDAGGFLKV